MKNLKKMYGLTGRGHLFDYLLHFRYTHSMICSVTYGSSNSVVEVHILLLKAQCCVHISVCTSIKYHQEWQIL